MASDDMTRHERYMRRCLELARTARRTRDTPVGSLIVRGTTVIAEGVEAVRARSDVTAHAEIEAIRRACDALAGLDLRECVLYTTAEPCFMCSYAIRETGITEVVVGVRVPHVGGASSRHPILTDPAIPGWSRPPSVVIGILQDECAALKR